MKWTKEKPTKPGFYWHKSSPDFELNIAHVRPHHYFDELEFILTGWDGGCLVNPNLGDEWAGPIEEPK